jgi:hypothetical protein
MREPASGNDEASTETGPNQQSLEIGSVVREEPVSNLSSSSILDPQHHSDQPNTGAPDENDGSRPSGRTDRIRHSSSLLVKRRRRGYCHASDDWYVPLFPEGPLNAWCAANGRSLSFRTFPDPVDNPLSSEPI